MCTFSVLSPYLFRLTFFCSRRWEFVTVSVLNLIAILCAYYYSPKLFISGGVLIILLVIFTLIAYVSFFVMGSYQQQFRKAINDVLQLNESLVANDRTLRESRQQLHALISSMNDTIFELDETSSASTYGLARKARLTLPRSSSSTSIC
jgi:two-component system sensor histidine kinase/response regulator